MNVHLKHKLVILSFGRSVLLSTKITAPGEWFANDLIKYNVPIVTNPCVLLSQRDLLLDTYSTSFSHIAI